MFDIGFSELFVIAIVALLVLGPERMPRAARFAGLWVRRARAQWYSVKADLENELADDELKRSLQEARDQLQGEMRDLRDGLQHRAQAVQGEFTLPGSAPRPAVAADVRPPAVDGAAPGGTGSAGANVGGASPLGPGMPLDGMPLDDMPLEGIPVERARGAAGPDASASAVAAPPAIAPGEADNDQR